MKTTDKHEQRSQKAADALRLLLAGIASSAIYAAYTVRKELDGDLWRGLAFIFGASLVCVAISWLSLKHRELRRREAAKHGAPSPTFSRWLHSWTWDRASLALLILGGLLFAIGFHR